MKVKKFQAETMPEAMKKVKNELGPDAVILNSKVVKKGGFFGLFKKSFTEVIAAIDPVDHSETETERQWKSRNTSSSSSSSDENRKIMKELRDMKTMLENQKTEYPPILQRTFEYMIENEMTKEHAAMLLEAVMEKYETPEEFGEARRLITLELYEKIKHCSFGMPTFQKKFIHLFGPTGVGKTTTLAKIAAFAVMNQQLRVGFITTDTYRIAAVEQLKTYAKILDVPLEVAYNPEDYRTAKEKFKDYDLVLVDTAGRNFRDGSFVQELKTIVDFNEESNNFLVFGLTSKYSDMKEVIAQFKDIPIDQMIFTKKDETSRIGNAVNMALSEQMGVAYITNGQNVPDDIEEASAMGLSRMMMEEFYSERPS